MTMLELSPMLFVMPSEVRWVRVWPEDSNLGPRIGVKFGDGIHDIWFQNFENLDVAKVAAAQLAEKVRMAFKI